MVSAEPGHSESHAAEKLVVETLTFEDVLPDAQQMVSAEPGHSESHAAEKLVVETLTFEDVLPDAQQVDKVLGCRVKGNELNSSHCMTVAATHDLPAKKSVFSDDLHRTSEKNESYDIPIDGGATVNSLKAAEDTLNQFDAKKKFKKASVADKINEQQGTEVDLVLGLGQMPHNYSSFPKNHRKVLENTMMRTRTGPSNFLKRKSIEDIWSEDELDFLWMGVRRHGTGNWEAMLQDPRLKFSKFKTAEDLFSRWEEEQHKILDLPALPVQKPFKSSKSSKSPFFPGISDALMIRALRGSRFAGPPKFLSYLKDVKLGFNSQPSNEHLAPDPTWKANNLQKSFSGPSSVRPCYRPGTSNLERPFLLDLLGASTLGTLGLKCSNSFDLQKREENLQKQEDELRRSWKLPSFLDKSLNILRESNNIGSGKSKISSLLADPDKGQNMFHSKLKDFAGSSSKKELPYCLREAVGGPAKAESGLPPSVSAIAQSIRILYGDDNLTIPPFLAPDPPPVQPKDPRRILKKNKRRRERVQTFKQFFQDIAGTSRNFQSSLHAENIGSTSLLPTKSPFTLLPQLYGATSGLPYWEPNRNMPPLSLNVLNPSSVSVYSHTQKKKTEMTPAPEALQWVASSVAPGPLETSSKSAGSNAPLPDSVEQVIVPVPEDACEEQKGNEFSSTGMLSPHTDEKAEQTESRDFSKTHSDPIQPKAEETSSEGTAADHHGSE